MKKENRKPLKKILISAGSVTILVLAAVSFIVIPAMLPDNQKKLPEFGSYKGKKIEYVQGSYFSQAVDYYVSEQEKTGKDLDTSTRFQIFMQAFRDAVLMYAFSDEVKASGYIPARSLIERTMLPYFYNTNNMYSAKIFRDTPDSRKAEIRKHVEQQLTYNRYASDINNLKYSAAETAFIADMNKEMRSFNAAFFSLNKYPENEAAEFGKNNADLFVKYDLSVITLDTEAEAKKLAVRLKNNELIFTDAVSEYSSKQYSDEKGVLSEAYYYRLKNIINSETALKEITALEPGTISSAVKTSAGFSIFTATGPAVPADFSDAETVSRVYNYMMVYEMGIIEEYFIHIAKDFSAEAAVHGFNAAAEKFNAETAAVPAFPINYGNSQLLSSIPFGTIPQLAEAQSNEKFLTAVFSLTENEISAPVVLGKNVAVLQLNEIKNDETVSAEALQSLYPYYTSQFDATAVLSFFTESPHVKNNAVNAFFAHFKSTN